MSRIRSPSGKSLNLKPENSHMSSRKQFLHHFLEKRAVRVEARVEELVQVKSLGLLFSKLEIPHPLLV